MPQVIYANDFGQLGGLMQAEQSNEALNAYRTATLAEAERRARQQQGQFNATMLQNLALHNAQLAASKAQHTGELDYKNRALNISKEYQDWLMKQPAKADEKSTAAAENFALQKLVTDVNTDGTLDTSSDAFKKAHPLIQETLVAAATDRQKQLKPSFDRRLAALSIANQAARMEQVAAGIGDTKMEQDRGLEAQGWSPFNSSANSPADPQAIAADLKSKAATLRNANKKLLDEAALTQDPKTKHFTTQFPAWYKEAVGRQLRMATPPTAGTGTNAVPVGLPVQVPLSPADQALGSLTRQTMESRVPNFAPGFTNAPTPMTGTNQPRLPRYQKQGGVWFELQPDGSYAAVQLGK